MVFLFLFFKDLDKNIKDIKDIKESNIKFIKGEFMNKDWNIKIMEKKKFEIYSKKKT